MPNARPRTVRAVGVITLTTDFGLKDPSSA